MMELLKDIEDRDETIATLRARVETLKAALRPFAVDMLQPKHDRLERTMSDFEDEEDPFEAALRLARATVLDLSRVAEEADRAHKRAADCLYDLKILVESRVEEENG